MGNRTAGSALGHRQSRAPLVVCALSILFVLVFLLSLALGSVRIPIGDIVTVLTGGEPLRDSFSVVIQDVRLPRALTAILAGAALSIAGLQMQTIFRNPLADPFVLGISSGASLGVALLVLTSGAAQIGVFGDTVGLAGDALLILAAIAGAALTLILVLLVSMRIPNPATVLILGLMFGYGSSALVTVLVAGTSPEQLQRWVSWGFGSFSGVTWARLRLFAPMVGAGLIIAIATTKHLNALLLGEHYAQSMGAPVRRVQILTMAGASILGGVVTAFCGPISFLGIATPHICRVLLASSDHRALVPAVILMGGTLAMLAQIAALLPGSYGVLPLNAVTALLGAPIIVAVLLRSRRGVFTA